MLEAQATTELLPQAESVASMAEEPERFTPETIGVVAEAVPLTSALAAQHWQTEKLLAVAVAVALIIMVPIRIGVDPVAD